MAAVLASVLVAACAVRLETAEKPATECLLARVAGVIAVDPALGVGVRTADGEFRRTVWPFGWTARIEFGSAVLYDMRGLAVAREGNEIAMAGFVSEDGIAYPCGPVVIIG